MPPHRQIIQFVCFETAVARQVFLARWEPFAASFLARGIERVVLGEGSGGAGYGFVSRNIWPEERFAAAFLGTLPADAGGGPVTAVQAGAFRVVASAGMDLLRARTDVIKHLALLRGAGDPLSALVPTLGRLAAEHDQGMGWATYAADPATRGGRFNAALEVYGDAASAARLGDALAAGLNTASGVEERRFQQLREVLALP